MQIDLRDDPSCKHEGALCEDCGELVYFPQTLCDCGTEIAWVDYDGHTVARYRPSTEGVKYAFRLFGITYFRSKREWTTWQSLERRHGAESIIKKAKWANSRKLRGFRALGVVKNLLLGESDGADRSTGSGGSKKYSRFSREGIL